MNEHILYFNGIDADSGDYLRPPKTLYLEPPQERRPRYVRYDVDLKDLASAGWGIVLACGDPLEKVILEALTPLLDLRRSQASGEKPNRYQEFTGDRGYLQGESKLDFLERLGIGPGPVDPDRLPYYILIVGSPEQIPYSFQYELDVPCGVGRIYFESVEEYARYARSVVEAETRAPERPRKVVLFGAQSDPPTEVSVNELLVPLGEALQKRSNWELETIFGEAASKSRLGAVLGGEETPSILFTAGHGVGFRCGGPNQRLSQGALLCQDWPGKGHLATPAHYFTADDVSGSTRLRGLVSFHFACYSAGTPIHDDFSLNGGRPQIAPQAFVARLPMSLLSHPAGGSLAFVGHVDQACESSFVWRTAGSQVLVFTECLARLQDYYPVGAALEPLSQRYAELAASLTSMFDRSQLNSGISDEIVLLQHACRDARNYVIVGDPAVRLPVATPPPAKRRILRG